MDPEKETNSELGKKILNYNREFVEKRSLYTQITQMPHVLRKWAERLTSFQSILRNWKELIYLSVGLLYLVSPIDLIPELIFGVFGLIDDVLIVGAFLTLISNSFLHVFSE
uniref:DUF1232 domain-containing protein n=1 Tax=Euplotes crassus TaxID=5936 RepID=A0A7S3KGN0_EUPCR|mmetsp:Transcript_26090/g.25944  ORF Transcript_26090/g.25944 Transcript_26090/m.25944 type:complete len:111 (+) Transcript_26090:305-637(+)